MQMTKNFRRDDHAVNALTCAASIRHGINRLTVRFLDSSNERTTLSSHLYLTTAEARQLAADLIAAADAQEPRRQNLKVKVERRFDGSLAPSLLVTLEDAAKTGSLDAALAHLNASDLNPDLWLTGRSGSHVWLSQVRDGRTDRVAMIADFE